MGAQLVNQSSNATVSKPWDCCMTKKASLCSVVLTALCHSLPLTANCCRKSCWTDASMACRPSSLCTTSYWRKWLPNVTSCCNQLER